MYMLSRRRGNWRMNIRMQHKMTIKNKFLNWVKQLKADLQALQIAVKLNLIPWHTKLLVLITAAYALSPIDLIGAFRRLHYCSIAYCKPDFHGHYDGECRAAFNYSKCFYLAYCFAFNG